MSFFPSFANWKRNFQFRDLPSLHSCAAVAGIMAPPHVCCKSQLGGRRRSATLWGLPSLASCHPHSFCMLQRMKLWANANEIFSLCPPPPRLISSPAGRRAGEQMSQLRPPTHTANEFRFKKIEKKKTKFNSTARLAQSESKSKNNSL